MARPELTHARLCELLHYDPDFGEFRNRVQRSSRGRVGAVVGRVDRWGHRLIRIDSVDYSAHRLAWFYMTGGWPPQGAEIDHRNRVGSDNRWHNLRIATRSQNMGNRPAGGFYRLRGRYVSRIAGRWLGTFASQAEAQSAYQSAHIERYGQFSPYWREAVDG